MKHLLRIAAAAALALSAPSLFAQQTPSPPTNAPQSTPTPEEFDKQLATMSEQMKKMDEQMTQMSKTQDPQERQRLMQDHWATMQKSMGMMHGMWGSGAMGCCGGGNRAMGGHMMGGPMMMWGDYRQLSPEQLKQRQYMMDQWMPMQQRMMNHMMQHQNWMMQPQPSTPPNQ